MNIAVVGLWHLGLTTAACMADKGLSVLAYDPDATRIHDLEHDKIPIYEPGLTVLIEKAKRKGFLRFSNKISELRAYDTIWVTFDTPVNEGDQADVETVTKHIKDMVPYLPEKAMVLISSQLPIGTTRQLIQYCATHFAHKAIRFAYSPENLRLGSAIELFNHPDRIVVGVESDEDRIRLRDLLLPLTQNILWMSIESAEMTKHAINAFLATSVVFINEIATLCEQVGADAGDIERALKSEQRIGAKAYVRPGPAIGGGTLARDVNFLIAEGAKHGMPTTLMSALLASNEWHKQWACKRIQHALQTLENKTIATLGLTYKAGTDTLRRSNALQTCVWLHQQGAHVKAYDPHLRQLPHELSSVLQLEQTIQDALREADAVIINTEWPELTALTGDVLLTTLKQPLVLDASGFLHEQLSNDTRIRYFAVGRGA